MLRRPPTRIPLKTDDIEEYEDMLREKREIMKMEEDANKNDKNSNGNGNGDGNGGDNSFASPRNTNAKRKKSAAERIGIKGKR